MPGAPRTLLSREAVQLAAILLIALQLLNLGYGCDGTFTKLKQFHFVSRLMTGLDRAGASGNRFEKSWLGEICLPFPKQYVLGFDSQRRDFELPTLPSYLRGEWKQGGWWYYYIYGLLVKVPCGTWFLLAAVLIRRFLPKRQTAFFRDELILLAPAIALLLVVSSQTSLNQHLRYTFPSLGLGLVFLGQAAGASGEKTPPALPQRLLTQAAVSCVGLTLLSALWVYPHHLAYFNEFAGGPKNGHNHLRHSSCDWGQDWLELQALQQRSACSLKWSPADVVVSFPVEAALPGLPAASSNAGHPPDSRSVLPVVSRGRLTPTPPPRGTVRFEIGVYSVYSDDPY